MAIGAILAALGKVAKGAMKVGKATAKTATTGAQGAKGAASFGAKMTGAGAKMTAKGSEGMGKIVSKAGEVVTKNSGKIDNAISAVKKTGATSSGNKEQTPQSSSPVFSSDIPTSKYTPSVDPIKYLSDSNKRGQLYQ